MYKKMLKHCNKKNNKNKIYINNSMNMNSNLKDSNDVFIYK